MKFEKHGHIFQLTAVLQVSADLDTAWNFLSNPMNLKRITPEYMGFHVISGVEEEMYAGQIISYKVSPLFGVNLNWVTEITHVRPKEFFVDEQRKGPYALWHHKHFLKPIENGTEMKDVVHYQLPLPLISNHLHSIVVQPRLREIFNYRTEVLKEIFGTFKGPQSNK